LKIITWNVNGIRAVAKKGFEEFLVKEKPDILCLQESKAHRDQCEPALHNPLGYESHWSSAKKAGYSGTVSYFNPNNPNAKPKAVRQGIGIDEYDSEGRFVISDHEDFLLYNVYFPNGGSGDVRHAFKQKFLKVFTGHLIEQIKAGREVILVGDYNVAHTDIDVYNPAKLSNESGFLPEEREWFTKFLKVGFVDMFRQFHPNEPDRYTWWSYFEKARVGNRGWRIDYICATPKIAKRFTSCNQLEDQMGSDHCPVVAEIK
jgi:exodeoxyribonuclease III